ncbi:MAG: LLM class flavin-dependent oxidoreductase [Pyrinomonadaceae bacterium]|nr:LLM class flavin-dependent oxidoreductase [Pyrinomonadaceae bacterium]
MDLRFHWMLPKGGEVAVDKPQTVQAAARYRIESISRTSPAPRPDMEGWTHFARHAEEAGIESVLISFSRYEPDPLVTACALGQATKKLKFIAAYRSGLMQPATFVQQVNTLSALIEGRVALNIVAGSSTAEQRGYGDYLEHDERYARAEEFLAVCRAFWGNEGDVNFAGEYYRVEQGKLHTPFVASDRSAPEIYVSGHSPPAERVALSQSSCLLRVADIPGKLQPTVVRARQHGVEVCLRLCVLCRPTREEAISVAESLLPSRDIPKQERSVAIKDDSQMYMEARTISDRSDKWLTRSLWTGLVPYNGPVWTALIGTPPEIAGAILEYKRIGVTQFIMSGWPELDEVVTFGREVLPLVRQAEQSQQKHRA